MEKEKTVTTPEWKSWMGSCEYPVHGIPYQHDVIEIRRDGKVDIKTLTSFGSIKFLSKWRSKMRESETTP